MPWDFCRVTEPKARKDYCCDAAEWVLNSGVIEALTFSEKRTIVKARRDKWRIKKGTRYVKCQGKFNGEFTVFKARFDLAIICEAYKLYED